MPQLGRAFPLASQGSLSAAGAATDTFESGGDGFNLTIWGTFVGTARLERSFAGGPFVPLTYIDGGTLSWSAPMSTTMVEPEAGVIYRVVATALTSGALNWRMSR